MCIKEFARYQLKNKYEGRLHLIQVYKSQVVHPNPKNLFHLIDSFNFDK
jgi:hypothetical protein